MTVTPDASSFGNDGTIVGGVTLVASPWDDFDNALQFDGSTGAVNCGETVPQVNGVGAAGAFTLELRTGPNTAENAVQLVGWSDTYPYQLAIFQWNPGAVYVWLLDNTGTEQHVETAGVINDGNPHVVACDYDGETLRVYIDGAVSGSQALSGTAPPFTGHPFVVGLNGSSYLAYEGIIDEVRWSNVARYAGAYTPASEPFTSDANTLGLWHLDEVGTSPLPSSAGNFLALL
jgi:Concanavalin A-like lectin/glucanases superfamily